MKLYILQVITLVALLVGIVLLSGCGIFGEAEKPTGPGTLRLLITDTPCNADNIWVTISKVDVHREEYAWETIVDEEQTFDLIALTAVEELLGEKTLPGGHYTQIRLLVKEANIVVNGVTYPITIPSGIQTGIKLIHEFDITPETVITLLLDFNAQESIVNNPPGSNNYILKPVIPVVVETISGTISGVVEPPSSNALVDAYLSGTTEWKNSATIDTTDGSFTIHALVEGMYDLKITAEGYQEEMITGVQVIAQQDTDIGTITLTAQ